MAVCICSSSSSVKFIVNCVCVVGGVCVCGGGAVVVVMVTGEEVWWGPGLREGGGRRGERVVNVEDSKLMVQYWYLPVTSVEFLFEEDEEPRS